MKLIAFIIFMLISFVGGFLIFRYLYGSDPKKWKSLLFSSTDTFWNILNPKKKKGNNKE
jgi:hypothetical protein